MGRVTIFGGSGFIGRYVVRQLAKQGWEIRIACRDLEMANLLKPSGDVGQIVPWCCDITQLDHVIAAVRGADAVVNLPGDKVLTGSLIPGADGYGTFNVGAHTGDVTAATVKIGATGVKAIKALNVIVDDDETTFADTVDAKTITITQLTGGVNGTVIFGGDVIAASGIAVAGAGTTPIINVASGIDVTADLTVIRTNETIVNMVAGTSVWTGNLGTDAL